MSRALPLQLRAEWCYLSGQRERQLDLPKKLLHEHGVELNWTQRA